MSHGNFSPYWNESTLESRILKSLLYLLHVLLNYLKARLFNQKICTLPVLV